MKRAFYVLAVLLVAAAAGYYWWQNRTVEETAAPVPPTAATEPTPAPAEPAIKYPIEAVAPEAPTEPLPVEKADESIAALLADLLGGENLASFMRTGNFIQRLVATTDNLDRRFASPRLWPIQPMPGRFTVEGSGENFYIAAENNARYTRFVEFVDSIDTARAAALYVRLYPLCQNMYEALGFPGKYFNDRAVAVIDRLLATPEVEGPIPVKLTEVQGENKPARPWVNYQYVDPELEALTSGQKILLRVGSEHRRRLKNKLTEIRRYITGAAARL